VEKRQPQKGRERERERERCFAGSRSAGSFILALCRPVFIGFFIADKGKKVFSKRVMVPFLLPSLPTSFLHFSLSSSVITLSSDSKIPPVPPELYTQFISSDPIFLHSNNLPGIVILWKSPINVKKKEKVCFTFFLGALSSPYRVPIYTLGFYFALFVFTSYATVCSICSLGWTEDKDENEALCIHLFLLFIHAPGTRRQTSRKRGAVRERRERERGGWSRKGDSNNDNNNNGWDWSSWVQI
jgi:hypothetical protein